MTQVIDRLLKSLRSAKVYNPGVQTAPACILWPDGKCQWEAVIPRLQSELPELFILGNYNPEKRTGPAIWLRCVIAGKFEDVKLTGDKTPIIYLPGASRQDLRAVETCPDMLKPLAELQYRGAIWSQLNNRDWTILAFLKSDQGGLNLDVALDSSAKNAMQLALGHLLDEDIELLKGKRLDKEYFSTLLSGGDPVRDLLQWLDHADAFREDRSDNEWWAFMEVCKSKFAFNPEEDGILAGAAKLAFHGGPWNPVWERFCEAPKLYPQIPDLIGKAAPPRDKIYWHTGDGGGHCDGWPQWNEEKENNLRKDLEILSSLPSHEARKKIVELEKRHGERRNLVWAELDEASLARALKHLSVLATVTTNALAAGTIDDLVAGYQTAGWQADDALVQALACVEKSKDSEVVNTVIRAIYLSWAEDSARYLQKIVDELGYPGSSATTNKIPEYRDGECILFIDGLRFDVARRLEKLLANKGCVIEEKIVWSALPSVTATGKPAVTPVRDKLQGPDASVDFEPCVADSRQALKSGYHLKKLLKEAGWEILDHSSNGDGNGNAWCEFGNIDREGHIRGWKLAMHIEGMLGEIQDRVIQLLEAGWKSVHIVTDHGWLLLPGGLPKIELASVLTETKWGRCAVIKPGASTDERQYPWYWNSNQHFALADGISCFRNGMEYSHGGLSLQECLTLELTVSSGSSHASHASLKITDVAWRGLRCTIAVDGEFSGLLLDIRTQPGNPSSSVVVSVKPLKENGTASVVVENEELDESSATIVLLDQNDNLVAQEATVIGGGRK